MRTDRELLELAAKAADIKINHDLPSWNAWNPLSNNGDALWLAVVLGIPLNFCHASGAAWAVNPWNGAEHTEPGGADLKASEAATRRAIVCAAAEIGKAMP